MNTCEATSTTFNEFEAEFREYVKRRVCTLLRYRPDLIDDVIQETWIKVWRAFPPAHTRNIKAWLWLIATNVVRDAMKAAKVRQAHCSSLEASMDYLGIDEENNMHLMTPDPHAYLPEQWERESLRQAIWNKACDSDKQALLAFVHNDALHKQALYNARRNFKDRYARAEQKMEVAV